MKTSRNIAIVVSILTALLIAGCSEDKKHKLENGVMFAARALEGANANPLSRATFQGYMRNGNPVDYIKAVLPKTNPPFDSYEFKQPTHPWTIVIRPGTDPGEYYIEGYGDSLKQPIKSASVTIKEE
ncbi:MAG: hypothetical protein C5B54_04995 [Acidobacteria bacterium]|nr:MAG: hypothetical protein C5B54_04995 [Acidobacteriota bacterium]